MNTKPENTTNDLQMDGTTLYREEIFTDRRVGTIRRLTPVKADGAPDPARKSVFIGEAQLLTNVGALPLSFEINAQSLEEAVTNYAAAVKQAFERAMKELQEMRREAASSIVIPDKGAGGFGPGGLPGGGKIQLR
ncbi:MAG TPA: hypothetical protein VEI74_14400 [Candidatus Methylomirabilis sp.]|nr:hypothetical protein [Candidatus Methylomirabilis sp.]